MNFGSNVEIIWQIDELWVSNSLKLSYGRTLEQTSRKKNELLAPSMMEIKQVHVSMNFDTNVETNFDKDELLGSKPSEDLLGPKFWQT